MNCSPTIAIALLLLSLTAGTWLLYKTQKENMGGFFKFVSWFVITASFLAMICCAMCCAMRCCMMHRGCGEMERCERGMGECGMGGGMNKRIIIMRGGEGECEMEEGCCKEKMKHCEMEEEGCEGEKMECCKGDKDKCEMKMEMKKDTAVKKK